MLRYDTHKELTGVRANDYRKALHGIENQNCMYPSDRLAIFANICRLPTTLHTVGLQETIG
jgi:hypothetical protein